MLNISMLKVAKNYGIIKNYFLSEELEDWKAKFQLNSVTKSIYGDNRKLSPETQLTHGDDCWGIDINCLSYAWFKKIVWAKILQLFNPDMKLIFASYTNCSTVAPVHIDIKTVPNNEKGQHYVSILIPYSIDNKKDNFQKVSTGFYNENKELKEQIQWEENCLIWWDSTLWHASSDFKKENIESKQFFVIHTYV